jgi:hypothetical protein
MAELARQRRVRRFDVNTQLPVGETRHSFDAQSTAGRGAREDLQWALPSKALGFISQVE